MRRDHDCRCRQPSQEESEEAYRGLGADWHVVSRSSSCNKHKEVENGSLSR